MSRVYGGSEVASLLILRLQHLLQVRRDLWAGSVHWIRQDQLRDDPNRSVYRSQIYLPMPLTRESILENAITDFLNIGSHCLLLTWHPMADQSKWIQKACSPTKPFIRPIRLLSYDDCVLVHYFDFTLLAGDGCTYGTMCKLLTDNSALVGSDSVSCLTV